MDRLSKTRKEFRGKRSHFQAAGLQAWGRLPRAERQEGISGFGNVEVGGKSPQVLDGMSNSLEVR